MESKNPVRKRIKTNDKMKIKNETKRQRKIFWQRSSHHQEYCVIVGYFQAKSVIKATEGGNLLDIACGDGSITKILETHFERVMGVDASRKHLTKAQKNCPKAEFHESLIEDFNTEERFDVITMFNLLEHVKNPVKILKKASSFLKEDGKLIVHVPNAMAVNRVLAKIMGTLIDEYELSPFDKKVAGHRRSYDLHLLKKDIEKAGLKLISSGGIFYKMLSTPQMNWLLENGLWEEGGYGWGRVGAEKKDWKFEFCRACYEYGKQKPEDCNIIYVIVKK